MSRKLFRISQKLSSQMFASNICLATEYFFCLAEFTDFFVQCFEINEMSPIKEGEVEPSGLLIIDVNLQAIKLPTRSLSIPVKPKKELY